MKTLKFSIFAMVLALVSTQVWAASPYPSGSYEVDPMHSKIGFEIPHLVIATVEGKFTQAQGKIDLAEKFNQSKLDTNVDIASIDTGVQKRDDHLKSPDFFDAKKYPKMTFKSTAIEGTPEAFKLTGDLTIHGVTKKVTLEGKYLGSVVDGFGNQKVAFSAKGKINRKDFGLNWNNMVEAGPVVGDEVTIDLKIQAGRPAPKVGQK